MKKRALLDLDGVIRDYTGAVTKVYLQYYPDHTVKKILSRNLEEYFPVRENIYSFIFDHFPEITEEMQLYPGIQEVLQKEREQFEIVIVTSQEEWGVEATLSWIERKGLPVDDVIFTFNKESVSGYALLDDWEWNVEMFLQTGRRAYLLEQPWNQSWHGPKVKSVQQFFDRIK